MGSRSTLAAVAAIERQESVETLRDLLEATGAELTDYGDANPRMAVVGDTAEALRRVTSDVAATDDYAVSVLVSALVKICAAQQEHIEAQDRALDHIVDHVIAGIDADMKLLRENVEALDTGDDDTGEAVE